MSIRGITLYLKNQKYQYEVAAVYVTNVAQSGGYYDYLHKETRKSTDGVFTENGSLSALSDGGYRQ